MHLDARRPVCPVASTFLASWEADLPDPEKRRLLTPLRPRLSSTRIATGSAMLKASSAVDWLVRVAAPTWLELAGGDPAALGALKGCPRLEVDADSRRGRIAIDRAIQGVLNARMIACNAAWSRSRAPREELREEGTAIAETLLPVATAVLGRSGFRAAIAAADRAPSTQRWPALRDHLLGLGQAAASVLAWEAVWATAAHREPTGWRAAAGRWLDRETNAVAMTMQPQAFVLAQGLLAP